MSSAVVSTSAALRRPFLFAADPEPQVGLIAHVGTAALGCPVERISTGIESAAVRIFPSILNQKSAIAIVPASRLAIRPAPDMASTGISELDALTGGLPRGCLTEVCGPASSGRTTVLLSALAAATRRGEYCALIDASDALDASSAAAAGVDLDRLLWARCGEDSRKPRSVGASPAVAGASCPRTSEHRLEQLLRATDLLLESGGFGLIVLDLAGMSPQAARRIPLTTWFRFRRAVEHKPTILLAIEEIPIAGSCSSLLLQLAAKRQKNTAHGVSRWSHDGDDKAPQERNKNCISNSVPTHAHLLSALKINVELIRSRLDRKPARSITFESKTAWTG